MVHAYRFGIEEEFFLADARSRGTPRARLRAFHAAVRARLDDAEREQLQCQVEIASPPSDDVDEAAARLAELRGRLAGIGGERGILVFAAGTHPTARWRDQRPTDKARYHGIMADLRMLGRRNLVCGLHVHVEVPDPEARIGLMRRLLPFLPVLLALSTSSPFWQGQQTGMAGYRMRAYAELPRTGLPELFADAADYAHYVDVMTRAGAVADASYLWWHLRASVKYPTLELRVADSCTRLDDALCVASLFRCLVRLAVRDRSLNGDLTAASRGFIMENLWRAERDGVRATLIDEARARAVPLTDTVEDLLAATAQDAEALGCVEACARARAIAADGTSADRQMAVFSAARRSGANERAALSAVVDHLAAETAAGPKRGPGGAPERRSGGVTTDTDPAEGGTGARVPSAALDAYGRHGESHGYVSEACLMIASAPDSSARRLPSRRSRWASAPGRQPHARSRLPSAPSSAIPDVFPETP